MNRRILWIFILILVIFRCTNLYVSDSHHIYLKKPKYFKKIYKKNLPCDKL